MVFLIKKKTTTNATLTGNTTTTTTTGHNHEAIGENKQENKLHQQKYQQYL